MMFHQAQYAVSSSLCTAVLFSDIAHFTVTIFHIFLQAEKDQNDISKKVADLNRQRESCHEELGKLKMLISFIMQATTFWEEVIMLASAATVKTEQVQKIADLAAKKNSVKILSSRGTETKMRSFEESWMEVAEMFASEENKLLLNGELHRSKLAFM